MGDGIARRALPSLLIPEPRSTVSLPLDELLSRGLPMALPLGLLLDLTGVCPTGVTLTSCRVTLAAKVDISDWRAEATLPGSISTGRVPLVGETLDALINDLLADSTTPLCARGSLPGWARCDFRRFLDIVSG